MLSVAHRQTLESESESVASAAEPLRSGQAWYALRLRPKSEHLASATLRGKGYEEFLPVYRSLRRWSDRVMVHNVFRRSRHAISRQVSQIVSVLGEKAGETAARLG